MAAAEATRMMDDAERDAIRQPTDSESPDAPNNPDVWDLRGRVNRLLAENDELRGIVNDSGNQAAKYWRQMQQTKAAEHERDELKRAHSLMAAQFRTMQREKEHGWREADRQEARAESAEQERDALRRVVDDLIDPNPCWFDHHGYCQAHGWLSDGTCPHAAAKSLRGAAIGGAT